MSPGQINFNAGDEESFTLAETTPIMDVDGEPTHYITFSVQIETPAQLEAGREFFKGPMQFQDLEKGALIVPVMINGEPLTWEEVYLVTLQRLMKDDEFIAKAAAETD
jgi:hypothetical protein